MLNLHRYFLSIYYKSNWDKQNFDLYNHLLILLIKILLVRSFSIRNFFQCNIKPLKPPIRNWSEINLATMRKVTFYYFYSMRVIRANIPTVITLLVDHFFQGVAALTGCRRNGRLFRLKTFYGVRVYVDLCRCLEEAEEGRRAN